LGRATLLSEQAEAGDAFPGFILAAGIEIAETRCQQYLLWGRGMTEARGAPGWSVLTEARTGPLYVPVSGLKENERAALHVREYLTVERCHGNTLVAEERLVEIREVADGDR
jgi:CRISPR-associated protein (TIGR03984 family)